MAVSPSHACGQCDYCREGREQLCRNMRFLGSASLYPHVQGMFSEFFVMGERQCYPVAGDVTLGELAFAEPLAVGAARRQARRRSRRQVGADHGRRHDRLPHGDRGAPRRREIGDRVRHPRPAARAGARGRRRPHAARRSRRATRSRRRSSTSATRSRAASPRSKSCVAAAKRGGVDRAGGHAAARAAAVRRQRADGEGARPPGRVPLGHRVRLGGRLHRRRAASTCGRSCPASFRCRTPSQAFELAKDKTQEHEGSGGRC